MSIDVKKNGLYIGDCRDILKDWYDNHIRNFIDLIYIDPPFNSKRDYNIVHGNSEMLEKAFRDTWSNAPYSEDLSSIKKIAPDIYEFIVLFIEQINLSKAHISYLVTMTIRCWYMREMLKDDGCFYYHCNSVMSHYVKVILDFIFGVGNFRNEIIWSFSSGKRPSPKSFLKNHEVIFFYAKSDETKLNNNFYEYKEVKTFQTDDDGCFYTLPVGDYSDQSIEEMENNGLIYRTKNNTPRIKRYLENIDGKYYKKGHPSDVFEITALGQKGKSKEYLGYPTQKPEELLEKIIKTSTNKDDMVCDFFMGGGTTISVADRLGRRWIGCDINNRSLQITKNRIEKHGLKQGIHYYISGIPKSSMDLKRLLDNGDMNGFDLEECVIKYHLPPEVIGNQKKVGDGGIDGVFRFEYNNEDYKGIVQITSGSNINHFKAFASEVEKPNILGVYISFAEKITSSMINKAKEKGKIGDVDKLQILTLEDLIDHGKLIEIPEVKDAYFSRFKSLRQGYKSFF